MSSAPAALLPRKSAVQARSQATLEALHVAAIQVLTREGLTRCTTTRIAERAGMSVGSLYQYYPNRDALLAAVLERHLVGIADAIDRSCAAYRGKPVAEMAEGLVTAFLGAKLRDPEESKALYAVAGERGGAALADRASRRMAAALTVLLASAPDAHFDDAEQAAVISLGTLVGSVRALLDGHAPSDFESGLKQQLTLMLTAYYAAHRRQCSPVLPDSATPGIT